MTSIKKSLSYISIFACIVCDVDLKLLPCKNTQKENKQKIHCKIWDSY